MTRAAVTLLMLAIGAPLGAQSGSDASQREAREILVEMIGINTSLDRGDVTSLAEKLAARFRGAGVA